MQNRLRCSWRRPRSSRVQDRHWPEGYTGSHAADKGLCLKDFEQVQMDNLLAERSARAAEIMLDLDRGFMIEQPWPWKEDADAGAVVSDVLELVVRLSLDPSLGLRVPRALTVQGQR